MAGNHAKKTISGGSAFISIECLKAIIKRY
jgi:hypothetical protein